MKIIFLDIDGVMNDPGCYSNNIPYKYVKGSDEGYSPFTINSVKVLNKLFIKYPDLRIVISSSWRVIYSLNQLQQIFLGEGVLIPIIGVTRNIHQGIDGRDEEILEWIKEHNYLQIISWVALDDCEFLMRKISEINRYVYIDDIWGLQDKHISRIEGILDGKY